MDIFTEMFRRYMRTPNTAYALNLDGPWGSGKTHFIKNEIKSILDSEFADYKHIYISLNGLNDVNEINENIFLQVYPTLAAKSYIWTRRGLNIIKHFNPKSDSSNLDVSSIDLKIKQYFYEKKLDKILLCFDDLERIDETLSIQRLFGYINTNFIEHNCVKTIIISNSEKIGENNKFNIHKEKIIGRTIQLKLNNDKVIREIVRKDYSILYPFYHKHIDEMNAIFSSIDKLNLRSVKFVFEILSEIFELLKVENNSISHRELMSIFACTLTVGIEYKNGNILSVEKAEELLNPYYMSNRTINENIDEVQDTELQQQLINKNIVVSKYFSYFESITNFVITGHFNIELLRDELKEKHKLPSEEELNFNIVESYNNFESDEVFLAVNKVIEAIKSGHYSPVKYPYIYSTLSELIDNNYVDITENLIEIMKSGLSIALNRLSNTSNLERDHVLNRYFHGYTDPETLTLINMIKAKINQLREEEINERVNEFVILIESDDRADIQKSMSYFQSKTNLFENLHSAKFHEKLFNMKNSSITLFDIILDNMYLRITNAKDYHYVEVPFMKEFKKKLDKEIDSLDGDFDKLKSGLIKKVSITIGKVIQHVDKDSRNT